MAAAMPRGRARRTLGRSLQRFGNAQGLRPAWRIGRPRELACTGFLDPRIEAVGKPIGIVGKDKLSARLNPLVCVAESLHMAVVDVEARSIGCSQTMQDIRLVQHLVDRDGGKCGDSEHLRPNAGVKERLLADLGVAGCIVPKGHFNVFGGCRCLNLREEQVERRHPLRRELTQEIGIEEVSVAFIALPSQIAGTRSPSGAKGLCGKCGVLKHSV
jgi:hypothetical protein